MTEEQYYEIAALLKGISHATTVGIVEGMKARKKAADFIKRLELEARLDEIQKCWDTWETHGLHEIVHDVPGIRGAMNGYEYSLTQRLGGLQAQLKGER